MDIREIKENGGEGDSKFLKNKINLLISNDCVVVCHG